MDKKDIYEHLAKIYLDASSKKDNKSKVDSVLIKNIFTGALIFLFGLGTTLVFFVPKNRSLNKEVELILAPEALKINFNFDPAKKEIFTLNLNKLDVSRYSKVGFAVKKANFQDNITLRVEFTSNYREKSEVYFRNIPHKWTDYKIDLSQFKGISDWSQMENLSFAVEEWNAREKKGVVYIDNVRLLK
ncbi:MAG: hypothetical protein KJ880_07445 [Candidatus Omnitrophica bacterium]|nr:hypothetical protein [Candidatus Omnitrophota bacterium]MBU1869405.1 hypothetical protein [Candidatus Omnitrophota bacterium]